MLREPTLTKMAPEGERISYLLIMETDDNRIYGSVVDITLLQTRAMGEALAYAFALRKAAVSLVAMVKQGASLPEGASCDIIRIIQNAALEHAVSNVHPPTGAPLSGPEASFKRGFWKRLGDALNVILSGK